MVKVMVEVKMVEKVVVKMGYFGVSWWKRGRRR